MAKGTGGGGPPPEGGGLMVVSLIPGPPPPFWSLDPTLSLKSPREERPDAGNIGNFVNIFIPLVSCAAT